MSDGRKPILSSFTGHKKRKAWNKTGEKYMSEESRQSLAETDRGSYYNQEEWLEEFLDNKGEFYNGSERDDSDNDDEIDNENNEQQQLSEGFANNCFKIVSPILLQELITTILPFASTVVAHFYLLKMQLVATVLEECGT